VKLINQIIESTGVDLSEYQFVNKVDKSLVGLVSGVRLADKKISLSLNHEVFWLYGKLKESAKAKGYVLNVDPVFWKAVQYSDGWHVYFKPVATLKPVDKSGIALSLNTFSHWIQFIKEGQPVKKTGLNSALVRMHRIKRIILRPNPFNITNPIKQLNLQSWCTDIAPKVLKRNQRGDYAVQRASALSLRLDSGVSQLPKSTLLKFKPIGERRLNQHGEGVKQIVWASKSPPKLWGFVKQTSVVIYNGTRVQCDLGDVIVMIGKRPLVLSIDDWEHSHLPLISRSHGQASIEGGYLRTKDDFGGSSNRSWGRVSNNDNLMQTPQLLNMLGDNIVTSIRFWSIPAKEFLFKIKDSYEQSKRG